ncbi:SDR family NAD(P)-dependent oxidoreductase [Yinghuangia seranimata]|uniref:type I polyketide synthase n=1 Tax=Yinghuangia seranimata TaxID=408067 RepID=UPI00248C7B1B|nr:type I polyketide synthase [Yinghuangia seranimata]MDI2128458.1 type I polyketide synthase [Yinghuangia seranimata]
MTSRIAIVGMACRFPDADNGLDLWENVLASRRSFRRIPPERIRLEDYYSPDVNAPDAFYTTQAALIKDWEFDRLRYKVAGSTYRRSDLAHWLTLEVSGEALADAGFPGGAGAPRENTGVLLGNSLTGEGYRTGLLRVRWPFVRRAVASVLAEEADMDTQRLAELLDRMEEVYKEPFPEWDGDSLAGGLSNTIAGRVCNHFDLGGGGYTVDGACASSLLAVATACNALANGDLDLAVAGGVDISIDTNELIGFARVGALSRTRMRVYDQRSDGFWPGEGAGMFVLMREEDALAQGRRIRAVVRGWGISSDGAGGITRPETDGQRLALERAYARAGYGPDEVAFFEGHGTGTAVGDAAELMAISEARRNADPGVAPAAIGSVKANIGHTKSAAGAAGLIKAIMAVNHRVLPPTTGCERPHPVLTEDRPALRVLRRAEEWPEDMPARAGVSGAGFGGINSHVTIESADPAPRRRRLDARTRALSASTQDAELFLLDADTLTALADRAKSEADHVRWLSFAELAAYAGDLNRRLTHRAVRAAVVADSPESACERFEKLAGLIGEGTESLIDAAGGLFLGAVGEAPRIAYLFPGQGSGSRTDGGALRRRFETVDELYKGVPALGVDLSGDHVDTAVAQPRIVTGSVAGLRVLADAGVSAIAAAGHSLGELVALHWAGAFDEDTVLKLAAARGAAMRELATESGAMASLATGAADAESLIGAEPVVLAGLNSPRQTVVSGPSEAVDRVVAKAAERGVQAVRLQVSHAFHSPLVAPAADAFAARLVDAEVRPPRRTVVSTVTGSALEPEADVRGLLRDQIEAPVRFTDALETIAKHADLLVEVGPGEVLTGLARETVAVPVLPMRTDEESVGGLLRVLGAAFALGAPLRPDELAAGRVVVGYDPDRIGEFIPNIVETGAVELPEELAALYGAGAPARPRPKKRKSAVADADADADDEPTSSDEAQDGDTPPEDALLLLRRLVAERAEFPLDAVQPSGRFLDDLHLSSIVVSEIIVEATRRLGLTVPVAPTGYATATIAEVADALRQLAETGEVAAEDAEAVAARVAPPGVAPWVRAFASTWEATPVGARTAHRSVGAWTVVGATPEHDPDGIAARLKTALEEAESGTGVVVWVPPQRDTACVDVLREGAAAILGNKAVTRALFVQTGPGAAGFAKTLAQEAPWVSVAVVTVPAAGGLAPEAVAAALADEVLAGAAFAETSVDAEGVRRTPVMRPIDVDGEITEAGLPLGAEDVVLVTGGGKGIAAECALDLARASGAALILMGRSDPAADPELAANLERVAGQGVRAVYARADVTDAERVAAALAEAREQLGGGPVTALLHGAGGNVPKLLEELTDEDYRRTIGPKVDGMRTVLAAVEPERLRLLVTFGSMTGRAGLRGNADYAIANEWQSDEVERLAAELPNCRCRAVEWSVWSGVGMGERLGTVDNLSRTGMTAITPDAGVAMLRALATDPAAPVVTLVTGRFGEMPTLPLERPELPLLRFLETPRVYYPGVELVADAEMSMAFDPILVDHAFHGNAVIPGTLGMEIMAQAAVGVMGLDEVPVLEDVEFLRTVDVPAEGAVTVRVAALVTAPGRVETVVRTSATGFHTDHYRAVCRFGTEAHPGHGYAAEGDAELPPIVLDPATDVYGPVLFHGPRFQYLENVTRIGKSITTHSKVASAEPPFAHFLPDRLVLGDFAARDAYLQSAQLAAPGLLVVPVGLKRLAVASPAAGTVPADVMLRRANPGERTNTAGWNIDVLGPDGQLLEVWEGVRGDAIGTLPLPDVWAPALLGPYLEISGLLLDRRVDVHVEPDRSGTSRRAMSDLALRRLLGAQTTVRRRPDGRPEVSGGPTVSVAHGAGVTLAAAVHGGVLGCDVETVLTRTDRKWQGLLGEQNLALADALAAQRGEDAAVARTRLWAAQECAVKAGMAAPTAFTLAETAVPDAENDGWAVLGAGAQRVATLAVRVQGTAEPVVFAFLGDRDADTEGEAVGWHKGPRDSDGTGAGTGQGGR